MPAKWMFRSRKGAGDNRTSNRSVENAWPNEDGSVGRHGRCFRNCRRRTGPVAAKSEKGDRKRPGLLRCRPGPVAATWNQALGDLAGRTGAAKPEGDAAANAVAQRRTQPARQIIRRIPTWSARFNPG